MKCFSSKKTRTIRQSEFNLLKAKHRFNNIQEIIDLKERFQYISNSKSKITKQAFRENMGLLGLDSGMFLTDRIFVAMDYDYDGELNIEDFLHYFDILMYGDASEKSELTFKMIDLDGDGIFDFTDFSDLIYSILLFWNNITGNQHDIKHNIKLRNFIENVFNKFDAYKDGKITLDTFKKVVIQEPHLLEIFDYFNKGISESLNPFGELDPKEKKILDEIELLEHNLISLKNYLDDKEDDIYLNSRNSEKRYSRGLSNEFISSPDIKNIDNYNKSILLKPLKVDLHLDKSDTKVNIIEAKNLHNTDNNISPNKFLPNRKLSSPGKLENFMSLKKSEMIYLDPDNSDDDDQIIIDNPLCANNAKINKNVSEIFAFENLLNQIQNSAYANIVPPKYHQSKIILKQIERKNFLDTNNEEAHGDPLITVNSMSFNKNFSNKQASLFEKKFSDFRMSNAFLNTYNNDFLSPINYDNNINQHYYHHMQNNFNTNPYTTNKFSTNNDNEIGYNEIEINVDKDNQDKSVKILERLDSVISCDIPIRQKIYKIDVKKFRKDSNNSIVNRSISCDQQEKSEQKQEQQQQSQDNQQNRNRLIGFNTENIRMQFRNELMNYNHNRKNNDKRNDEFKVRKIAAKLEEMIAHTKKITEEIKSKQKKDEEKREEEKQLEFMKDITAQNIPRPKIRQNGSFVFFGHQNWNLVLNMMLGIRMAVKSVNNSKQEEINSKDFKLKYYFELLPRRTTEMKNSYKICTFFDYAPNVFHEIRKIFGIKNEDYLKSIGPEAMLNNLIQGNISSLAELTSTGKSGSFFYFSADGKYTLKTISRDEFHFLKSILKGYYNHFVTNPNSLIIRFYGCHKIKFVKSRMNKQKIYFIIMANVFNTPKEINIRYDLKGSTFGRWTPEENDSSIAKKDINLIKSDTKILLTRSFANVFLNQIQRDCAFFEQNDIIDYSLLIGIHVINKDKLNLTEKTNIPSALRESAQRKIIEEGLFNNEGISSADGRFLYFFGIIDVLTKFNSKKKLEYCFKRVAYGKGISAVPPRDYSQRFQKFIANAIKPI